MNGDNIYKIPHLKKDVQMKRGFGNCTRHVTK
ncbi:hypothetical protein H257_19259, partial [Aphanomyces astaci]